MRKIILVALCAAGACTGAQAADWTKFVGSNPNFPNQLADNGLAVDDSNGYAAIDAYNLANWSGQIEFVHQYTIDSTGNIPWAWGLVGKNPSYAIVPHGVQLRDGLRTTWIERQVAPGDLWNTPSDTIGFGAPNVPPPNFWHVEPRTNGRVVAHLSMGSQGVALLRALDAGAGYEVISLNAGASLRWRTTVQPCNFGVDPSDLALDYAAGFPVMQSAISVAGTCATGTGPQVFAQHLDTNTGSASAAEWIAPPPGRTLLRYAFSPAHELIAAYGTPWPMQEIWRIGAPGAPWTAPPGPVFGLSSIDAFAPTSGNNLVAVGRDSGSGAQAILPILQSPGPSPITVPDLAAFGAGDWQFAVDDNGRILAWRKETAGTATLVRLVGLHPAGQVVEWTKTIDNVLAAAQPQVIAPRDAHHGFVVAVDTQAVDGTVGVHVERVGSTP